MSNSSIVFGWEATTTATGAVFGLTAGLVSTAAFFVSLTGVGAEVTFLAGFLVVEVFLTSGFTIFFSIFFSAGAAFLAVPFFEVLVAVAVCDIVVIVLLS